MHLLVAIQLKDEPEFMQEFQDLSVVLYEKMKEAGSDQVSRFLTEEEIMVVLNYMPSMISMIKEPTKEMQELVLQRRKGRQYLKDISAPSNDVIRHALSNNKIKFTDIPYDKRTPDVEITAFLRGDINLGQVHKKEFMDSIESRPGQFVSSWDFPTFIDKIEKNRNYLTVQELERLRMAFVVYNQMNISLGGDFAISHMRNPSPSKAVKERAVETNPYAIGAIPFQYDEIQMLALKTAFLPNDWRDWDLMATYNLIKKPSVVVQKMYDDLRNLKSDMWYIANIKNQPAWMQLWLLDKINPLRFDADRLIARAESVIKNPTKKVSDKIAEMREWQCRGTRGNGRSW